MEAAIDLALHKLVCLTEPELAARAACGGAVDELRAVTSCPLACAVRREHLQYSAWRAAGVADPVAALAALSAMPDREPLVATPCPLSDTQRDSCEVSRYLHGMGQ